jgi:hypothetical protein
VRLPNSDRTVIDDAKVRDYLLSPSHPVGRFKSVFFAALGFSQANWQTLRDALLELARSDSATPGQPSPFGQKFEVRGSHRVPRLAMFKLLDTVVLDRDLPEQDLRRGDLGAVVDVRPPDGLEVEFVLASGKTQALVSLRSADVRAVAEGDLIAVRDLKRTA